MGVDATTIGRRLRRLETRTGVTLFEQTREGQVLTEAGEAMLAQVEAMPKLDGRQMIMVLAPRKKVVPTKESGS